MLTELTWDVGVEGEKSFGSYVKLELGSVSWTCVWGKQTEVRRHRKFGFLCFKLWGYVISSIGHWLCRDYKCWKEGTNVNTEAARTETKKDMVLGEIFIHVYNPLNLPGLFNYRHLFLVCHSCDIWVFSSWSLCLCVIICLESCTLVVTCLDLALRSYASTSFLVTVFIPRGLGLLHYVLFIILSYN